MPSIGPEWERLGFIVDHAVPGGPIRVVVVVVRALVMRMAAEVQRIVGVENVRLAYLRWRFGLVTGLEAAERLEQLLVVYVKAVVCEADRLHRRLRHRHVGKEVEHAAPLFWRVLPRRRFDRSRFQRVDGRYDLGWCRAC